MNTDGKRGLTGNADGGQYQAVLHDEMAGQHGKRLLVTRSGRVDENARREVTVTIA